MIAAYEQIEGANLPQDDYQTAWAYMPCASPARCHWLAALSANGSRQMVSEKIPTSANRNLTSDRHRAAVVVVVVVVGGGGGGRYLRTLDESELGKPFTPPAGTPVTLLARISHLSLLSKHDSVAGDALNKRSYPPWTTVETCYDLQGMLLLIWILGPGSVTYKAVRGQHVSMGQSLLVAAWMHLFTACCSELVSH